MASKSGIDVAIDKVLTDFKISTLKAEQRTILDCLIEKKDCIAILPTGFGKSLPYQMLVSVRRELEKETSSDDVGKRGSQLFQGGVGCQVLVSSPKIIILRHTVKRLPKIGTLFSNDFYSNCDLFTLHNVQQLYIENFKILLVKLVKRQGIQNYVVLNHAVNIKVEDIAKGTTGFNGADIQDLVNQAALKAAMEGEDMVKEKHLYWARDKVLMEEYNQTKAKLTAEMDVAMGGRVAEEIIFGSDHVTTGASSDFQSASRIATAMVTKLGMSDKLGVRVFDIQQQDGGLGFIMVNQYSEAVTKEIDSEIKRLLQESYDRAKKILTNHSEQHKELAKMLMKYETLNKDEIKLVMDGKPLNKKVFS
ncbi:ATP-dependent metalloprotease [Mytilus galloprovincialis]|uniref:ATP-dependent metalloprotease n=1 Tax=Mytilus galloprovincialis TaxID=29158 RepID=A0A8B6HHF2_MYTGA|nr:ATP-dependent metalloprotease [Mytilus galloprovincialis]